MSQCAQDTKKTIKDNRLDIERFNSVELATSACAEPTIEPMHIRHKENNKGRSAITCDYDDVMIMILDVP